MDGCKDGLREHCRPHHGSFWCAIRELSMIRGLVGPSWGVLRIMTCLFGGGGFSLGGGGGGVLRSKRKKEKTALCVRRAHSSR